MDWTQRTKALAKKHRMTPARVSALRRRHAPATLRPCKTTPKDDPWRTVGFSCPRSLRDRIFAYGADRGLSLSAALRLMAEEALSRLDVSTK